MMEFTTFLSVDRSLTAAVPLAKRIRSASMDFPCCYGGVSTVPRSYLPPQEQHSGSLRTDPPSSTTERRACDGHGSHAG